MPLRQWSVGREFYRRMKKAFDRQGIEMPAVNQTHYLPSGAGAVDGLDPPSSPRSSAARS